MGWAVEENGRLTECDENETTIEIALYFYVRTRRLVCRKALEDQPCAFNACYSLKESWP